MTGQGKLALGRVMHCRLRPKRHQFRYRVFSVLLDVDHLGRDLSRLRLMALDGFGFLAFCQRDHGPRDGTALRPWIETHLARHGIPRPARIDILAFPRVLGCVFNPLSTYFCRDAEGALLAIVYEVKNTFGDQIAYVARADGTAMERHSQAKEMYVSPFIEMDQTYRFATRLGPDDLALRIKQAGAAGETLIATHNASLGPLSDRALLWAFVTHPLMPLKVIGAIHWQALRLVLKGVRFNRYSRSVPFLHKSPAE